MSLLEPAQPSSESAGSLTPGDTLHLLKHTWTLWFDAAFRKTTQENWENNIESITSVDSVESFWALFQNLPETTSFPGGTNVHFFRRGIKPSWEDTMNEGGGKWTINCPKVDDGSYLGSIGTPKIWREAVNKTNCFYWANLLLAGCMYQQ